MRPTDDDFTKTFLVHAPALKRAAVDGDEGARLVMNFAVLCVVQPDEEEDKLCLEALDCWLKRRELAAC
jgi:hypothetical protein